MTSVLGKRKQKEGGGVRKRQALQYLLTDFPDEILSLITKFLVANSYLGYQDIYDIIRLDMVWRSLSRFRMALGHRIQDMNVLLDWVVGPSHQRWNLLHHPAQSPIWLHLSDISLLRCCLRFCFYDDCPPRLFAVCRYGRDEPVFLGGLRNMMMSESFLSEIEMIHIHYGVHSHPHFNSKKELPYFIKHHLRGVKYIRIHDGGFPPEVAEKVRTFVESFPVPSKTLILHLDEGMECLQGSKQPLRSVRNVLIKMNGCKEPSFILNIPTILPNLRSVRLYGNKETDPLPLAVFCMMSSPTVVDIAACIAPRHLSNLIEGRSSNLRVKLLVEKCDKEKFTWGDLNILLSPTPFGLPSGYVSIVL